VNFAARQLVANVEAWIGPNFSGRSDALRRRIDGAGGTLLGGSTSSAISGLQDSVAGELRLYCCGNAETYRRITRHATTLGLDRIWHQNPFSGECSGGQEAALAILCRLALGRRELGLDVCVEQLSIDLRRCLYREILPDYPGTRVHLIDNRIDEVDTTPAPADANIAPASSPGLVIDGLVFSYGGPHIFNRVGATFGPGIHHLHGPNGAGKTTLAKLIAGLLRPTRGTLTLRGEVIRPYSRPGQYAAYAFQDPDLQLFTPTVGAAFGHRIPDIATRLGLGDHLNVHPLDLPWVLRKRLSIAAALARPTPMIVLDEPTLGQDAATCQLLSDHLVAEAAAGRIIILITHAEQFPRSVKAQRLDILTLPPTSADGNAG
jgi:energy-coupling factor transporter ATP-binding protein EcfA2